MTHLTNISEEASLVLVSELISALERERLANGQPSLVAALKTAIAHSWSKNSDAVPGLRIGLADAQLVLEWVEKAAADASAGEDPHFGDLVAGPRPER